jgi:general secretion pathway protein K
VYVADGYAPMNVNTADPLLLRALADDLSEKNVELLIRAIKDKPFKKIETFLQQDSIATLGINKEGLGVTSNHFLLSGAIRVGKILLVFDSHLKRQDNGKMTLLKRQRRSPDNG